MSPVSKGRKRKPNKSKRRSARPPRLPEVSTEHDADRAPYLADLSPGVSEAEVEQVLARRLFTIPATATEEFDQLNPADSDERGMLIRAEHPEFYKYVEDPAWDGEINGMNPRFHLTMHEVIANQLWDNDPPEVWEAAQRLRDNGIERHDILHELARIMTEHLHPTLARGEPFDSDAYREALNSLG